MHSVSLLTEGEACRVNDIVTGEPLIAHCVDELDALLQHATGSTAGHDAEHALQVLVHADLAASTNTPMLTPDQVKIVRLAAVLHDADDSKVFKAVSAPPPGATPAVKYPNAFRIVKDAVARPEFGGLSSDLAADFATQVVSVIALVSTSANGTSVPAGTEHWQLLVRHADRLEALGLIGVQRCYDYTLDTNRPIATADTWRAVSAEDLYQRVAPKARFAMYCGAAAPDGPQFPCAGSGKSLSMVDHFYDKLLHVGSADCFPSAAENEYLAAAAAERHQVIERFALDFGATGIVDPAAFGRTGPVVDVNAM